MCNVRIKIGPLREIVKIQCATEYKILNTEPDIEKVLLRYKLFLLWKYLEHTERKQKKIKVTCNPQPVLEETTIDSKNMFLNIFFILQLLLSERISCRTNKFV